MSTEITKAKIEWQKKMATIIDHIMKENKYTQIVAETDTNSPFFTDSCLIVNLHYELGRLRDMLKDAARYSELIIKAEEKQ